MKRWRPLPGGWWIIPGAMVGVALWLLVMEALLS